MVTGNPGKARANNAGLVNLDAAADKSLVEPTNWEPGRKTAEVCGWARHLAEALSAECIGGQRIPPIIEITNNNRRKWFG